MSFSILLLIVCITYIIYKYVYKPHRHWKERNIQHNTPCPVLGDLGKLMIKRETIMENTIRMYQSFPNSRYMGMYQFMTPILLIRDLNLIKKITVKDFDHFHDHKQVISEEIDELFGRSLISLKGEKWRDMRATLSPAFTSSKMKSMFILISEVAEKFPQHFLKNNPEETITLSMKNIFTKFANDVIATTAFGLKCDSLADENNEFFVMGKNVSDPNTWRMIKFAIFSFSPKLFQILQLKLFPQKLSDFFRKIVKDTIKVREEKGIIRPDMLHLLMEARKGKLKQEQSGQNVKDTGFATVEESTLGTAKQELSDDDIIAQAVLFFFAGFTTSSALLCFMSYELAVNPDIQEKLQEEIDDTLTACKGRITYEAILKMKYLDMTVSESLRKWPPGIGAERATVKEYTIPPERPEENLITLEVGSQVFISILAMHRDPNYFPNPDKFDPERFSDENKHNIVPGSYAPFGFGPRNCIGSRFALLETKAIILHLLSKFNIVVVEKTKMSPQVSFNLDDFWLGLKAR